MKKIIFFILIITKGISYSQTQDEDSFERYTNQAQILYKDIEGFKNIPFERESFSIHPNILGSLFLKKIFNPQQNVLITFTIIPYHFNEKTIFYENQAPMCVNISDYDVTKGKIIYGDSDILKRYNANLYVNYPIRLFESYEGNYHLCRKIYIQNSKKGSASIFFFYNEEKSEYVLNLLNQFYEYLKFKK